MKSTENDAARVVRNWKLFRNLEAYNVVLVGKAGGETLCHSEALVFILVLENLGTSPPSFCSTSDLFITICGLSDPQSEVLIWI